MIRVAAYWNGFGDLWAVASHACLRARRERQPVRLSRWSNKAQWDRARDLREILACFDPAFTRGVELCDERFEDLPRFGVREHREAYVPTRRRWAPRRSRIVACQLETHTVHTPERFCAPGLADALRAELPGFELVALGRHRHLGIRDIVEVLARCAAFVGIDSGISHVAHSVGTPVFLKDHAELALTHPGKAYAAFEDQADLLPRLREHLRVTKRRWWSWPRLK
jgi:hypothetical protein